MYKLGFIGMGNMASALMNGFINSGAVKADEICGSDISTACQNNAKTRGVSVMADNHATVKNADIIFIAVKPQVLEQVVAEIRGDLKGKAVVSIALGYSFDRYEELLDQSTRHLTIMPNTPAEVGEGMTIVEDVHTLTEEEYKDVMVLLESIGSVQVLSPGLMGVGGALSGCGPAYIYMIIEGLADGAVKNGLPRAAAYKMASQTVLGAAKMQLESGMHPGILKDNVTSPAGSTIRGVKALEDHGVRSAMIDAIDKACGN